MNRSYVLSVMMWRSVEMWRSVVMWSELMWFMWSDFILKWSEVSYGEVLRDISTILRVILHWGYLIILWLFHLGLSCTMVVWTCFVICGCVCVDFVMCRCFGNMCTCIYCRLYCLYFVFCIVSFVYTYSYCFVCINLRTTATDRQINCS